ncbi:MAG TPA: hypothetical protein ENJ35_10110 [Gammaproteobacteria bacterium]|nr:hypothetical protein [Gammaproteobacteria bacterium]
MNKIDPFEQINDPLCRCTIRVNNRPFHVYHLVAAGLEDKWIDPEESVASESTDCDAMHIFIYRNEAYRLRLDGGITINADDQSYIPTQALKAIGRVFQDMETVGEDAIAWAPCSLQLLFYSYLIDDHEMPGGHA